MLDDTAVGCLYIYFKVCWHRLYWPRGKV